MPLPQPPDDETLLIRTDFSDDVAWHALHDLLLSQPDGEFVVDGLNFVDDRVFRANWREEPTATPTAPKPRPAITSRRSVLVELGCWVFVVIGAAMVVDHASAQDVVVGVLAIAFFGSGAVLGIMTRRRT